MLATAVAKDFCDGEDQRNETCRQASHGEHEGEPAGIGMGSMVAYASEDGESEQRGNHSCGEDADAGTKECARI